MTVLFGDTWVDTNAVALPSHTPTGSNAGLSWSRGVFAANDMVIQGNGCVGGTAGFADIHAVFNQSGSWPADVSVAFDMHFFTNINNNFPAVTLRHLTGSDRCYAAQYDGTTGWGIGIFSTANPGVFTQLQAGSSYVYPGNGTTDHMIFEVQGTALRLYKNGVLDASTTDSTIAAAGKPGVYTTCGTLAAAATGYHFENFVVSDFSGAAAFQPRDLQHTPQHQSLIAQ